MTSSPPAADDETLRSVRDATARRANDDRPREEGEATAPDTGDSTDDVTVRARRTVRAGSAKAVDAAPAATAAPDADPTQEADAATDETAGAGRRIAVRPDAAAREDPTPIRTASVFIASRTPPPPSSEPQHPVDTVEVGRDIRSKAIARTLTLVALGALVLAAAAGGLVVLVSGLG